MSKSKCDLCGEPVSPIQECTCDTCGKRTCEECGRTVAVHAGTVNRADKWECNECEFGRPS